MLAFRPKASGSLLSGHGRKDTLSRKRRCSIFIHINFNPFIICSGCHFDMIKLFTMKCMLNDLALCAVATTLLAQGRGSSRYNNSSPPDRPSTSASAYRIARSHHNLPHHRTSTKPFACRQDYVRVSLPCL